MFASVVCARGTFHDFSEVQSLPHGVALNLTHRDDAISSNDGNPYLSAARLAFSDRPLNQNVQCPATDVQYPANGNIHSNQQAVYKIQNRAAIRSKSSISVCACDKQKGGRGWVIMGRQAPVRGKQVRQ